MGTPLATIPLVNAIVFWAYGDAKRWMTATDPRRSELPIWQLAAAGAYAGVVNSSVVCPVELVRGPARVRYRLYVPTSPVGVCVRTHAPVRPVLLFDPYAYILFMYV